MRRIFRTSSRTHRSDRRFPFALDRKPWEAKVRAYTKAFRDSPDIFNSIVTFSAQAQNSYQVNTEGTQLQFGQIRYRLELFIQGKAPDGMDIERYYNFDWVNPKRCARATKTCRPPARRCARRWKGW